MKVSVIIPVYKTEQYLKKCLTSVLNQTLDSIEIIIVNDGSPDNSENIINDYINKNTNIKYIYKENGGQASARNAGIAIATGEYIAFVDSDDWVNFDMYKTLYNNAVSMDLDVVYCDICSVENEKNKIVSYRNHIDDDVRRNFIIKADGPCNMLIKRTLLTDNGIIFPDDIIYEDLAIIPFLGVLTNKIGYVNKAFYYYLRRDNSTMLMRSYNEKLLDVYKALNKLYELWQKKDSEKKFYKEFEYIFIRRLLMSATLRLLEFKESKEYIAKNSKIMDEKFSKWRKNIYFKRLPLKQKMVAFLSYYNLTYLLLFLVKIKKIIK